MTWDRMTDILHALRTAGLKAVAIADSDGRASIRHARWDTLERSLAGQAVWTGKLSAARHWLRRYLFYLFAAADDHQLLIDNTAASHVITFAGEGCRGEFRQLVPGSAAPTWPTACSGYLIPCRKAPAPRPFPQATTRPLAGALGEALARRE